MDSSTPGEIKYRRIHVHRRRSRYRTLFRNLISHLMKLAFIFITTGLLIDGLTPRQLTNQHLTLLSSALSKGSHHTHLQTSVANLQPSIRLLDIPTAPSIDTLSALITYRRTLYWSPIESITLVEYPPLSAAIVLPVYWSRVTIHVLNGTLSLTELSSKRTESESSMSIGRFSPASLHTSSQPALVLEYASGFMPARMLQCAIYKTIVTGDVRAVLTAPLNIAWWTARYTNRQLLPHILAGLSNGASTLAAPVDALLRGARAVAEEAGVRKRRRGRRRV